MKREECTVGAEVYTEDGLSYRYTVVALPDEEGMVQVEPIGSSYISKDSFHLDDLFLYDYEKVKEAGARIQAKVDAATNAFEIAFKALHELRDIEDEETGLRRYSLEDAGFLSLKELEKTVDQNGWSSSALWC